MLTFVSELNNQFKQITSESFHEINRKKTVVYPYLTYDFDSEYLERNVDGFYIDVNVFDNNSSYRNIFKIEEELKAYFKDNKIMTDDMFIRFSFLRSIKVPTLDDTIKRRNLQFYCKVDWRKK